MKRWLFILTASGVLSFIIGFIFGPVILQSNGSSPRESQVQWVSAASTIAELTAEADAIVRAKVGSAYQTRAIIIPLPTDGVGNRPRFDVVPFTDRELLVTAVYKGNVAVDDEITIMQTGGELAATQQRPAVKHEIHDDPLFVENGDHILFLKDISGDSVHAPGRQLYRIVNPAGRYDVQAKGIRTNAELSSASLPSSIDVLMDQLNEALNQ